jgi:hypothetical protein
MKTGLWQLVCSIDGKYAKVRSLSKATLEEISNRIANGCREGRILEPETNYETIKKEVK